MANKFIEVETKTIINISEIVCIVPMKSINSEKDVYIIGFTIILKNGERINSSYLSKYEEIKKALLTEE